MSKASGSEASSGNMPCEKHLLLSPEDTLAVQSSSSDIGCCAWRESGCPLF